MQKELAFQSSVEELKTSVSEGKALVAAAVTDKGVSTAADATFQTIANNISNLPSGGRMVRKTYDRRETQGGSTVFYYYTIDPGYVLYETVFIYPVNFSVYAHIDYLDRDMGIGNLTYAYQNVETELYFRGVNTVYAGLTVSYGECYIIYI